MADFDTEIKGLRAPVTANIDRIQDRLVAAGLISMAAINSALFDSGAESVLGALESSLPREEFERLMEGLSVESGIEYEKFSPKNIDRNLDRRDPALYRPLIEDHHAVPLRMDPGSGQLIVAVTDPLNCNLEPWCKLYGCSVRPILVSEADLNKYVLIISSRLPLAERPNLRQNIDEHPADVKVDAIDPEIEEIVGDLLLAAARHSLSHLRLDNCEGVTWILCKAGGREVRWRIPVVFEKALSWFETMDDHANALYIRGDIKIKFHVDAKPDRIEIHDPRFMIDGVEDLYLAPEPRPNPLKLLVAGDKSDEMPDCWPLVKDLDQVELSRSRSDALVVNAIKQPGLVIVDCSFPELNAGELIRNLRDSTERELAIYVVLGLEQAKLGQGLLELGADRCVTADELPQLVKDYLKA